MAGKEQAPALPVQRSKGRGLDLLWAGFLAMRPVQWTKSLVLLLPLAFSMNRVSAWDDPGFFGDRIPQLVAAVLIFCALSAVVYIVNDVFDRERDRAHPKKSQRPIASGEFPLAAAQSTAALLLVLSLAGGFLLDTWFGIVCSAYVVMNLSYSAVLKRLIILDVMLISTGYVLRVVAGALIVDVDVSPWLYITIGLGALFIAIGKRYSEVKSAGTNAATQRAVLGEYSLTLLSQFLSIASTATLVAYTLYTIEAPAVPKDNSMMLTVPFVIFGVFRYLYLINQTDEAESPELVIVRDLPLLAAMVLWATTAFSVMIIAK